MDFQHIHYHKLIYSARIHKCSITEPICYWEFLSNYLSDVLGGNIYQTFLYERLISANHSFKKWK